MEVIAEGMLAPGEHVVVDAAHREHVHHAGRALVAYKEGVLSLVNWHELSEHYSAASFYTASLYSTQANQMIIQYPLAKEILVSSFFSQDFFIIIIKKHLQLIPYQVVFQK